MKILLVGNNFSNYENVIESEFIKLGDFVSRLSYKSFIPNRLKYQNSGLNLFFYFFLSVISFPARCIISIKVLLAINKYDLILCINGSFLIEKVISLSKNSSNIFIWIMDPIIKFPRTLLLKHTCKILSYSEDDCRVFGLKFLPLFSAIEIPPSNFGNNVLNRQKYIVAFIGAVDLYRLFLLEELARRCVANNSAFFVGGVFGRLSQAGSLFKNSKFFTVLRKNFLLRRFSFSEIYDVYSSSQFIFNYNVGDHVGASMRFFEALALGKEQLCDISIVKTRYCSFILRVQESNTVLGFPAYKSCLSHSEVCKAVSPASRLKHLKKVFSRLKGG